MELVRGLIRLGAFSHGAGQRLDKTGGLQPWSCMFRGLIRLGAFSHGAGQRLDKTGGLQPWSCSEA